MNVYSSILILASLLRTLTAEEEVEDMYERFRDIFPGDVPLIQDLLRNDTGIPTESVEYGLQPSCNAVDDSKFNICLDLISVRGTFQKWMNAFGAAVARWESIVVGNLDSFVPVKAVLPSGMGLTCTDYPTQIDDIYICGSDDIIDGAGGTLGFASVLFVRTQGSDINPRTGDPYITTLSGRMAFDMDDIVELELKGTWVDVVLHEMGHVLGIGSLWEFNGVYTRGEDFYADGTHAQAEFEALGCSGLLPVETEFGAGTAFAHWDEECLSHELMTGFLSGRDQPFSKITVGSLEDMGYEVDYDAADDYTINDLGFCGDSCDNPVNIPGRLLQYSGVKPKPILSHNGLAAARRYAKKELLAQQAQVDKMGRLPEGVRYVGGEHLVVMYSEADALFSVPIAWNDVKDLDLD